MDAVSGLTSKNKTFLSLDGYSFHCDRKNVEKNRYYWCCVNAYDEKTVDGKKQKIRICKARAVSSIVNGVHAAEARGAHAEMCDPKPQTVQLAAFRHQLKGEFSGKV